MMSPTSIPPPPPGHKRHSIHSQHAVAHLEISDIKPRPVRDEKWLRRDLSSYETWTLKPNPEIDEAYDKKGPPAKGALFPNRWDDIVKSHMVFEKEAAEKRIKDLNSECPIAEKYEKLFPNQRQQVDLLVTNRQNEESEPKFFEWTLAQYERKEKKWNYVKHKKQTSALILYLKRAPKSTIDLAQLRHRLWEEANQDSHLLNHSSDGHGSHGKGSNGILPPGSSASESSRRSSSSRSSSGSLSNSSAATIHSWLGTPATSHSSGSQSPKRHSTRHHRRHSPVRHHSRRDTSSAPDYRRGGHRHSNRIPVAPEAPSQGNYGRGFVEGIAAGVRAADQLRPPALARRRSSTASISSSGSSYGESILPSHRHHRARHGYAPLDEGNRRSRRNERYWESDADVASLARVLDAWRVRRR